MLRLYVKILFLSMYETIWKPPAFKRSDCSAPVPFSQQRGSASCSVRAHWLAHPEAAVARGRSAEDKFNSGNSSSSYSRIRLTLPASRGRARTENSSSPILTKLPEDGENERANRIWIMTNSHEHLGEKIMQLLFTKQRSPTEKHYF